ncbi:hypothetical protein BVC80_8393g6 [Macleaya cordata]|uniref:SnoaL-like domain-containing protein n=1 Tax=Macleaya cordata TaxID=56857 RepID=A0A200Q734_MACCD|nr:hypothetical protein BVC80_8393g6 [Macleaya cordata]
MLQRRETNGSFNDGTVGSRDNYPHIELLGLSKPLSSFDDEFRDGELRMMIMHGKFCIIRVPFEWVINRDFTVEQDRVNPPDGWKAYYAATRAVVDVNAEFYEIIRERALSEMGRFWLKADYVKCVHCSGDLFTGYRAVMQSWHLAFNWGDEIAFQIQDVRVRVLSDMAWVTMRTCTNVDTGPFHDHGTPAPNGYALAWPRLRGCNSSRSRSSFVPLTHTRSLTNPHFIPLCSPSPASLVEENSSPILSDGVSTKPESSIEETEKLPLRGCKACGREEVEKGCNGEGRVQGGIATVPGFGWWPIKAYRPCPGFVASGGRYRRRGQSMDEVAWGRTEREASMVSTDDVQSR